MRPDLDLRAYFDTRATAIVMTVSLLALLAFAALGGLLVPLVLPEEVVDVETTVIALSLPLSLIIPAIAVLITAGEWSDRSIQFSLLQRPSRNAVLLSKTLAASVVTAGVVALAIALAAATTWIGGELLGQGADFSSMEGVMTTQLATLGSYLLISLAMGLLTQSSVLGLLSAIGIPFLTATAVPLAALTGSELFIDVVRAVDLPGAAVALGDGRAGAFELLPLALTVLLPAALGVWRWNRREVG